MVGPNGRSISYKSFLIRIIINGYKDPDIAESSSHNYNRGSYLRVCSCYLGGKEGYRRRDEYDHRVGAASCPHVTDRSTPGRMSAAGGRTSAAGEGTSEVGGGASAAGGTVSSRTRVTAGRVLSRTGATGERLAAAGGRTPAAGRGVSSATGGKASRATKDHAGCGKGALNYFLCVRGTVFCCVYIRLYVIL